MDKKDTKIPTKTEMYSVVIHSFFQSVVMFKWEAFPSEAIYGHHSQTPARATPFP